MATFIRSAGDKFRSIPAVAPTAGVTLGKFVLYGDTYGIAFETKTTGLSYSLITECPNIIVPKTAGTGLTITVGDAIYLNTTSLTVQTNPTGGVLIGYALAAATATATTVRINMNCGKIDG
jgi:predicted RecA/RadA family phage recombinase